MLRLARVTHQWEHYVGTMLQAAQQAPRRRAAPGRADAPGGGVRDRPGAIWRAPRRCCTRCWPSSPRTPTALAFLDRIYDRQGTFDQLARGAAPAHRHHRRLARAGVAAPAPGPGAGRRAREPDRGHRQLPGGAGAGQPQRRGAGGAGAAVLPQRALGGAVRGLREDAGHRPGRRGAWPTATRAWPASPARCFEDREKAVGLWRKVLDLRGRRPGGAGGAGRPARAGRASGAS